MSCMLFVSFLLGTARFRSFAQMGPFLSPLQVPQAKTEEEYDAYLEILTSENPEQTVARVKSFARNFPKSQLLGLAFEHEMLAYQRLQEWFNVLHSGQKALQLEPRNVMTLLTVAAAIINGIHNQTIDHSLLDEAEQYAVESIQELGTMTIPHQLSLDRWERIRGDMEGQAHEILGEIAVIQGNNQKARKEFEASIRANPDPHGVQFLRLGLLSESLGNDEQASQAFGRAIELGPESVRNLARRELQKIQSGWAGQAMTRDKQTVKTTPPK